MDLPVAPLACEAVDKLTVPEETAHANTRGHEMTPIENVENSDCVVGIPSFDNDNNGEKMDQPFDMERAVSDSDVVITNDDPIASSIDAVASPAFEQSTETSDGGQAAPIVEVDLDDTKECDDFDEAEASAAPHTDSVEEFDDFDDLLGDLLCNEQQHSVETHSLESLSKEDDYDDLLGDLLGDDSEIKQNDNASRTVESPPQVERSTTADAKITPHISRIPKATTSRTASGKKNKSSTSGLSAKPASLGASNINASSINRRLVSPRSPPNVSGNRKQSDDSLNANSPWPAPPSGSKHDSPRSIGPSVTTARVSEASSDLTSPRVSHLARPPKKVNAGSRLVSPLATTTPVSNYNSPSRSLASTGSARSSGRRAFVFQGSSNPDGSPSSNLAVTCTGNLMLDLHSTVDGCENCLAFLTADETLQYQKDGHHYRVHRVRGGCSRSCAVFPRRDNEPPVRLCRQCFYGTHYKRTPTKGSVN